MAALSSKADVVRVVEVRPKWQKFLLIGCAMVAALAAVGSLALQMTQRDIVEQVDPITRLADRTNTGLDRVDRVRDTVTHVLTPTTWVPDRRETAAPTTETTYRIGPFTITKGERRIEISGNDDPR